MLCRQIARRSFAFGTPARVLDCVICCCLASLWAFDCDYAGSILGSKTGSSRSHLLLRRPGLSPSALDASEPRTLQPIRVLCRYSDGGCVG